MPKEQMLEELPSPIILFSLCFVYAMNYILERQLQLFIIRLFQDSAEDTYLKTSTSDVKVK